MAERTHDNELYDNHGEIELGGSSNAYTAATARSISGYHKGLRICGKANHTNNGASTLNLITPNAPSGLGATAIRKAATTALTGGEIVSGKYYDFIYDADNSVFQLDGAIGTAVEAAAVLADGRLVVGDGARGIETYERALAVSETDLDDLLTPGFYDGHTLTNSPDGSTSWFYIMVQEHSNADTYVSQTAWHLTGAGRIYARNRQAGVWQPWYRVLSPIVTGLADGDIFYYDGTHTVRLAAGTSGQLLQTNGAGSAPSWVDPPGPTVAAAQATTSGTAFDFTGIPSTASRITVNLNGVSCSSSTSFLVQIGDSGGIENTGYTSFSTFIGGSDETSTAGFVVRASSAGVHRGQAVMTRVGATNNWLFSHLGTLDNAGENMGVGAKTLSATLDRVRLTTTTGATFDGGSVNIIYD